MPVRQLGIENFRSFESVEVGFRNFNIVIGANASGKSNLIEAFNFIRSIWDYSLEDAVSMQGGPEYLRNVALGSSVPLRLSLSYEAEGRYLRKVKRKLIGLKIPFWRYEFSLQFAGGNGGYKIAQDELTRRYQVYQIQKRGDGTEESELLGAAQSTVTSLDGHIKYKVDIDEGLPIKERDLVPPFPPEALTLRSGSLLLEYQLHFVYPGWGPAFPGDIRVYDFAPKLAQRAAPVTGRAELEEDGSNLAIVLRGILDDEEKKRKLCNLVSDLLPFVQDLRVEKLLDRSLFFSLKETYADSSYLPASLLSDGTIGLIALVVALYFQSKPLVILEEPERNVHPSLIDKLCLVMKEVSERQQIIVSSHNPQVVQHADLDDLLLVSRDDRGFSVVTRPAQREDVKAFLANDLGIDDLLVMGLLGGSS